MLDEPAASAYGRIMDVPPDPVTSPDALTTLRALLRGHRGIGSVVGLSILSSLTEGIGLLIMVPLLLSLEAGDGRAAHYLDILGLSKTQFAMLALGLGFLLVMLRVAINLALNVQRRRLEQDVVDGLRMRIFGALGRAEWRWLSQQRGADHVAAMSTQLGRINAGLYAAIRVLGLLVSIGINLGVALVISWQTALAAILSGGLIAAIFRQQRGRVARLAQQVTPLSNHVHRLGQEGVTQLRLNRLLHRQPAAEAELGAAVQRLRDVQIGHGRDVALIGGAAQLVTAFVAVGLVAFGYALIGLPIGMLLPLLVAIVRIGPMIGGAQDSWNIWVHAAPTVEAVQRLIVQIDAAAEPVAAPDMPRIALVRDIRLSGVTLCYPGRDRPALERIDCRIEARTTTALVGPSGSGKSTFADLVTGLLAPDEGHVEVDGRILSGGDRIAWRRSVAYVDQHAMLFNATVRENLLAAVPGASEAELRAALDAASAQFVHSLPAGLDTAIGDDGVRLSGGERQRLALARALLDRPALLLLDEATSALDGDNQAAIADAIAALHGRMTILSISHGGWLLDRADRILRIENGRLTIER
ncbi:ATP-binding cassette domain-containing protein [Rhizorhabdus sp.]|uniref:ATP-binding cassette domain-containing protein n=1 Tax=Rhizorhabdus sp. TaxID=1968843 RepID=UPI0035AE0E1A